MKNNVRHFLDLLWGMTEKELRARYKYTIFGFLWIVINPVLQMIVIGFIFKFLIKEQIQNYYFYLFIGLLVWNFFSLSLSKATPAIVFERALIKKAKFPRSVIPLSIILSNFIHFLIAFLLFLIPVMFLGTLNLTKLPLVIFSFMLLIIFTCGISLLTCALNVKFRDISFFVQAILIIWFYACPIIYTINYVPYKMMWIWRLNPLTAIIQMLHNALLNFPAPGIGMLLANIIEILLFVICGIIVFRKESKNFDDWL